jgi:hypothetical protein
VRAGLDRTVPTRHVAGAEQPQNERGAGERRPPAADPRHAAPPDTFSGALSLPILFDGGEVELVRTLTLTRRERNWNGAGFTVSRRTESVLGRIDLDAPGSVAAGQTHHLHVVVPVPVTGEASVAGRLVQWDYAVRVRFPIGEQVVEATRGVNVPFGSDPSSLEELPAVVDDGAVAAVGFEDVSLHRF